MKRNVPSTLVAAFSITAFALQAAPLASQARASTDKFDYPELSVTPRASDRIEMEAGKEDGRRWSAQIPNLVPAAGVFAASLIQAGKSIPSDPGKDSSRSSSATIGMVAGGGWLAYSVYAALTENTYANATQELKALPKGSTREQLTRERMAEEILHRRARQARALRIAESLTLLGASAYLFVNSVDDVAGTTNPTTNTVTGGSAGTKATNIAAGVLSLVPLFFQSHYEEIDRTQEDYKKRIYAPVASSAILTEPSSGALVPGMLLTWKF